MSHRVITDIVDHGPVFTKIAKSAQKTPATMIEIQTLSLVEKKSDTGILTSKKKVTYFMKSH